MDFLADRRDCKRAESESFWLLLRFFGLLCERSLFAFFGRRAGVRLGIKQKNLVDPASNICLDGGLSHANVRISRFRQICGRLSKKGKKKEGEKVCG